MFAHDIAGWLGIPVGIVIAAMIILRRKGMALRARRQQARPPGQPASVWTASRQPIAEALTSQDNRPGHRTR